MDPGLASPCAVVKRLAGKTGWSASLWLLAGCWKTLARQPGQGKSRRESAVYGGV